MLGTRKKDREITFLSWKKVNKNTKQITSNYNNNRKGKRI